jgi:Tfp pilus assembly protein PilF
VVEPARPSLGSTVEEFAMSLSRVSLSASGPRGWVALSRLALVVVPLAMAGCASTVPLPPVTASLFDDAQFAPAIEPIDPNDALRMTPKMTAYLEEVIMPMARNRGVKDALMEALYSRNKLQLEYDSSSTRTAAEAFEARQGNCLSLVIMTGAFAKELNMNVTYQQVAMEEMWSRAGGMYFMSGHVNMLLEKRYTEAGGKFNRENFFTIDFMPNENVSMTAKPISEDTILAMYMNNRAAEAMVRGRLDDAYWRARAAIRLDPQFLSAYNTLGVIYLRHGDAQHAEQVLHFALGGAPDNPRVLANYVDALTKLGRTEEARTVQTHLAAVEPTPPFYWFVRGQAALHNGDARAARELFLKEIARAPDYHEFHFALAMADLQLGRLDEARSELALAMDDAVKRTDHDLYAAKLDRLNAYRPAAQSTLQ